MESFLSRTWPDPLKAPGSIKSRTRHCHANQCYVSVSWLAQQVFYLPCSAGVGSESAKSVPPPAPVVTVASVEQREITEWEEFTGRTEAVEAFNPDS